MQNIVTIVAPIVALGLGYVVAPVMADTYRRFRRPRSVICPETQTQEEIQLDTDLAVARSAFGPPELRIAHCSRLKQGDHCAEECLEQVE